MAVTQCQLSWALLATIGCSAVSGGDDGEDHGDDNDEYYEVNGLIKR